MKKFLITGSLGQIGTELAFKLASLYGKDKVVISDVMPKEDNLAYKEFPFEKLDVTDPKQFAEIVNKHDITYIMHLAGILSATGEKNPERLWNINMGGLYNAFEIAKENNLGVFLPSSIACFGDSTPHQNTPQDTLERPSTIYGVVKVAGEILGDYYHKRFGTDIRGLRFPGLISYKALPGGGTTDYAVEIYYKALQEGKYTCPLDKDTYMDMMYMDDAIDSIINLMEADPAKLIHRNSFNISAMSFSPKEIFAEIKKHIPNFTMDYNVNPELQAIANSWPDSLDVSAAKQEWGFAPKYDLEKMTVKMLDELKKKL